MFPQGEYTNNRSSTMLLLVIVPKSLMYTSSCIRQLRWSLFGATRRFVLWIYTGTEGSCYLLKVNFETASEIEMLSAQSKQIVRSNRDSKWVTYGWEYRSQSQSFCISNFVMCT